MQRTQAPTLVITADRTKMHTVEEARAYRRLIPDSSLVVIRSDAYHIAAADADEYVTHTLAFLEALDARPGDARLQPRRISAPASSRG